ETGARMLAERLVADRGWEVEVLTTCARDAITWADEFEPGTQWEHGVQVHRFVSESGRDRAFHPLWARLREDPGAASPAETAQWLDLQGPRSSALLDAVVASRADVIAFYPYLYHPTVRGLPLVRDRAVLHPAAHEEPALHLGLFDRLFATCRAFAFHSRSERALVQARFAVGATPQVVAGLGVQRPGPGADAGPAALARRTWDLGDAPYVVCVGRVDDQKGTGVLWRFFRAYKARRPGPLRLVLVGQEVDRPEPCDDVVVTGPVDETTKWALVEGARVLAAPSPHESFSLTVVEALSVGVPVLVNAVCGPTREHCVHSGGGLWFDDFASFEAALDVLCTDDTTHAVMGGLGRAYVARHFAWPVVLERYCSFLERTFAQG
ncbi:MAG TPA: glycosyltransferase family 4 protein, partial [Acidimicrobiales bacterium]|nr:glycosyltransferase family 4 protein [Acidimicrobiales bacterium]